MASSKTRIVVSNGKELRELMSIRENFNRDLQIMPRDHGHSDFSGADDKRDGFGRPIVSKASPSNAVREQHLSLHQTRKSKVGAMIARTIETADGHHLKLSALIANFGPTSIYPAIFRICGKLTADVYDHAPRPRDHIVHLGSLTEKETVFYAVLLCGTCSQAATISSIAPTIVLPFKAFAVAVLAYRIALPGLNFGNSAFTLTAPARIDGISITDHEMKPVAPMTPSEASEYIEGAYQILVRNTVEKALVRNLPAYLFNVGDVASVTDRLPLAREPE